MQVWQGFALAGMQQPDLVPALKRQGRQGCPTPARPRGLLFLAAG